MALVRRAIWAEDTAVDSTLEKGRLLISPERADRLLDQFATTARIWPKPSMETYV